MALGSMKFARSVVANCPEILFNSEYVGKAATLDTTAFTAGVCKAGNPIDKDGKVANTASAVGILLVDVYEDRPQGTIVIGGYVDAAKCNAHAGITLATAAMDAMKNVVFMNA